ncbi:VOC family protein [Paracoccus cavernae]|uniref:VOC family protein n=1 Tax=Paracoccus cavernae TaxID=1571207 RepID=UPI0035F389EC
MQITPYLFFQGQCAAAMAFYGEIFGTTPALTPFGQIPSHPGTPALRAEQQEWIIHAELRLPDGTTLMGADKPAQLGGAPQSGVSVALRFGDIDEARAVFEQLSDGGAVASPFGATFYSPGCGTTRDRYGTSWLVMTTESR